MTAYETYDLILDDGVIKEYPIGKAPIKARAKKTLSDDGSEIHSGHLVVNPLNRMPSLKSMIDSMNRSGQLAARIRAAENLQLAEDGDPAFEGYSRDWLEENWLSEQEAQFVYDLLPPADAPDASNPDSGTTPPEPTSTQTTAAHSPVPDPSQTAS